MIYGTKFVVWLCLLLLWGGVGGGRGLKVDFKRLNIAKCMHNIAGCQRSNIISVYAGN